MREATGFDNFSASCALAGRWSARLGMGEHRQQRQHREERFRRVVLLAIKKTRLAVTVPRPGKKTQARHRNRRSPVPPQVSGSPARTLPTWELDGLLTQNEVIGERASDPRGRRRLCR